MPFSHDDYAKLIYIGATRIYAGLNAGDILAVANNQDLTRQMSVNSAKELARLAGIEQEGD